MLTSLLRITPPGDGQNNTNLNSQGVVSYEQVLDDSSLIAPVWNARRGARDITAFDNQLFPGGVAPVLSTIIENFNSSIAIISFSIPGLFPAGDTIQAAIVGYDPLSGFNYYLPGVGGVSSLTINSVNYSPTLSNNGAPALAYSGLPRLIQGMIWHSGGVTPMHCSLNISLSGY